MCEVQSKLLNAHCSFPKQIAWFHLEPLEKSCHGIIPQRRGLTLLRNAAKFLSEGGNFLSKRGEFLAQGPLFFSEGR